MTKREFQTASFFKNKPVIYNEEVYLIKAVNFGDNIIGICKKNDPEDLGYTWISYKHCYLIH